MATAGCCISAAHASRLSTPAMLPCSACRGTLVASHDKPGRPYDGLEGCMQDMEGMQAAAASQQALRAPLCAHRPLLLTLDLPTPLPSQSLTTRIHLYVAQPVNSVDFSQTSHHRCMRVLEQGQALSNPFSISGDQYLKKFPRRGPNLEFRLVEISLEILKRVHAELHLLVRNTRCCC